MRIIESGSLRSLIRCTLVFAVCWELSLAGTQAALLDSLAQSTAKYGNPVQSGTGKAIFASEGWFIIEWFDDQNICQVCMYTHVSGGDITAEESKTLDSLNLTSNQRDWVDYPSQPMPSGVTGKAWVNRIGPTVIIMTGTEQQKDSSQRVERGYSTTKGINVMSKYQQGR